MDPRQHVNPGDPIVLAAEQINGLNRLLATPGGFRGPDAGEQATPYTWVLCRSSVTVARWGVLAITGLEITPATARGQAAFEAQPIVTGGTPAASTTAFGIAVEPIAAGKIGRVAVAGVVQVRAADLWKVPGSVLYADANWGLVQMGAGFRVGTISATWTKGATATVTQQQGDGTAISGSPAFTARNHYATITVSSGTKRVGCALAGSTWVLIAAEC